ncbi:hypothetical protein KBB76_01255 [Candidatus Saccharibacteria bacterium]|nr:hypothetical protein [Candidatus Saccharibacteria bacterium]HPW48316.1 hypothetical protein [Candidatus Saccharibacteria bacterium]
MKLNIKGETIVEVLLALTVLAVVLGGVFAISTRSKRTIQDNQERYQAQLIANSQADGLKIYVAEHGAPSTTSDFCMDGANLISETDSCKRGDGLYSVKITKAPGADDIFIIKVSWEGLNSINNEVNLVYGP